jgi:hypothetical protein
MHGSAENEWESSARTVSSGRAAFNNESTNDDFLHAHSLINRGGLHLRRMAPMKDLLVPSGPLAGLAGTVFNLSNYDDFRIDCGSAKLEIKGFLLLVVVAGCFFH